MQLDVRVPLGLMFFLIGLVLTGYGLWGGPEAVAPTSGMNVNARTGLALLVFGCICLALAWRARRKKP